jgi:hypothetical protein
MIKLDNLQNLTLAQFLTLDDNLQEIIFKKFLEAKGV